MHRTSVGEYKFTHRLRENCLNSRDQVVLRTSCCNGLIDAEDKVVFQLVGTQGGMLGCSCSDYIDSGESTADLPAMFDCCRKC